MMASSISTLLIFFIFGFLFFLSVKSQPNPLPLLSEIRNTGLSVGGVVLPDGMNQNIEGSPDAWWWLSVASPPHPSTNPGHFQNLTISRGPPEHTAPIGSFVAVKQQPEPGWFDEAIVQSLYGAAGWISPLSSGSRPSNDFPDLSNYRYVQQFRLPADFDPTTVQISIQCTADNNGTVFLNNIPTGLECAQNSNFDMVPEMITTSFVEGVNTLAINVLNTIGNPPNRNPTGLIAVVSGSFTCLPGFTYNPTTQTCDPNPTTSPPTTRPPTTTPPVTTPPTTTAPTTTPPVTTPPTTTPPTTRPPTTRPPTTRPPTTRPPTTRPPTTRPPTTRPPTTRPPTTRPPTTTPPTTSAPTTEPPVVITGDPHLRGFRGQHFDFMGLEDKVFSLISDSHGFAVNTRIGNADLRPKKTKTYMTEIGFIIGSDIFHVSCNRGEEGRIIQLNGEDLKAGESKSVWNNGFVKHTKAKNDRVIIKTDLYKISVRFSHSKHSSCHLNFRAKAFFDPEENSPHGVLGLTVRPTYATDGTEILTSEGKQGEGIIEGTYTDYLIKDNDLFGTEFKYSVFSRESSTINARRRTGANQEKKRKLSAFGY